MSRRVFALSLVLLLSLPACGRVGGGAAADVSGRTISVVATIGMIGDAVANIGGERVEVTTLMGPGVDPHLYKASEGDVTRLAGADIVFYNGLHLEARMAEVFEQMEDRVKTVAIGEAVDEGRLLAPPEFEGQFDPHIWFDVALWSAAVEAVRDELSDLDPDNADIYEANGDDYLAELDDLHAYVAEQAARVPEQLRVVVTAHDAFNYFGLAYGFEVRGLQGISTEAEAGAADVRSLAAFLVERGIPAIFIESSVPQRFVEAVQAAARARGGVVEIGGELYSDAMGDEGTPEGTYVGMVRHNIDTIVAALSGGDS